MNRPRCERDGCPAALCRLRRLQGRIRSRAVTRSAKMLNDKGLARYDFVLSRRTDSDDYGIWRFESESDDLLQPTPLNPDARFDRTHQIVSIGRYLLEWGPLTLEAYEPCFPYRLFELEPTSKDPLAAKALQRGLWPKTKFW